MNYTINRFVGITAALFFILSCSAASSPSETPSRNAVGNTNGSPYPFQSLQEGYQNSQAKQYRLSMYGEIRKLRTLEDEAVMAQAQALIDFCARAQACDGLESEALLLVDALSRSSLSAETRTHMIRNLVDSLNFQGTPAVNFYVPIAQVNLPLIRRVRPQAARVLLANAKRIAVSGRSATLETIIADLQTRVDLCALDYATDDSQMFLPEAEAKRKEMCSALGGGGSTATDTRMGEAILGGLTESNCFDIQATAQRPDPNALNLSDITSDIRDCFMASRQADNSTPDSGLTDPGEESNSVSTLGVMEDFDDQGNYYIMRLNFDTWDYQLSYFTKEGGTLLLYVEGNAATGQIKEITTLAENSKIGEDEITTPPSTSSSGGNDSNEDENEDADDDEGEEENDSPPQTTTSTTPPPPPLQDRIDGNVAECETVLNLFKSHKLTFASETPGARPGSWDPMPDGDIGGSGPAALGCDDENSSGELDEGLNCGLILCNANFFLNDSCVCQATALSFLKSPNPCADWDCPRGSTPVSKMNECSCEPAFSGEDDGGFPPGTGPGGGDPVGD